MEVQVGGWRDPDRGRASYRHRRKWGRSRVQVVVLLLVPLVAVTAAASLIHSSASAPTAQRPRPVHSGRPADQGLVVVNSARAGQGRPQLRFSPIAAHLAHLQSLAMARERRVFPQSCLTCTKLRMVWGNIEENVGSGTSAQAVYHELTQGHRNRAGALCGCVTQGGTAVVRSGGRVWVTGIFFRPSTGILLGARAQPQPSDPVVTGDPDEDALLYLEAEIGRKLTIDHLYVHLGTPFPYARFAWDNASGRIPFVDWDVIDPFYTWSQISAGKADKIINAEARAAAAYKRPIMLSFFHEPELGVPKYGTPAQFVAAWKHVVDRFRAAGATNVIWVWITEAKVFDQGAADGWYPGRSYVDYVGADGYNWFAARSHPKALWRSVNSLFSSFYAWSVEKHVPAMIAETGCLEDPSNPDRKAAWFQSADAWLHTHPNIKAFVYFNTTWRWPWLVDSSPQSLAAFRALANDPLFR